MSIADELNKLQDNLKKLYSVCEELGATLPENKNLDNLSETIKTVSTGSGEGLKVAVIGSAQEAQENDKVLLVPSAEVGGESVTATETGMTNAPINTNPLIYLSTFDKLTWYNRTSIYTYTSTITEMSTDNYSVETVQNRNDITVDGYWDLDHNVLISNYMGMGSGRDKTTFKLAIGSAQLALDNATHTGALYGVPSGFITLSVYNTYGTYPPNTRALLAVVYNIENNTLNKVTADSGMFFFKDGGSTWSLSPKTGEARKYDLDTGSVISTKQVSGALSTINDKSLGYALDEDGAYFITWKTTDDIRLSKLTKGSTWSISSIGYLKISQEVSGEVQIIRALKDGVNIHIFVVPANCNDTNNIKHFILNTQDDSVTVCHELLEIKGYDNIVATAFGGDPSKLSVCLVDGNGVNPNKVLIVNPLHNIMPYEYAAISFDKANLTSSAITGFIKSQDGSDALGNSIATVEALTDPNAPPFDISGQVFGMSVTVTEGEL